MSKRRRVALLLLVGLSSLGGVGFVAIACSDFTAAADGPDAGPFEAGTPETAEDAMPGDKWSCDGGVAPVVQLDESFANVGMALDRIEQNTGTIAIVVSDDAGSTSPLLRATATPTSMQSTNGARGLTKWMWPISGARSARLAYRFRASYDGFKVYSEVGCYLRLSRSVNGAYSSTYLVANPPNGLVLAGRHLTDDAGGSAAYTATPQLSTMAFTSTSALLRSVRTELTLSQPTSRVTARFDEASVDSATTFNLPGDPVGIELGCGILYADNSDQKLLQVYVDDVRLLVCP